MHACLMSLDVMGELLLISYTCMIVIHLQSTRFIMRQCEDQGGTGESQLYDTLFNLFTTQQEPLKVVVARMKSLILMRVWTDNGISH